MNDRPILLVTGRERVATRIWGIAFAVLYWLSRPLVHSPEAQGYAAAVREDSWPSLIHPYHLLYNGAIRFLWRLLCYVHPQLDPLSVAAVVNAVLAGLLLFIFARMLLENGTTYFWTSFATLGLGLSQCIWTLAAENDVYIAATLFLTLSARHSLRASREAGGSDTWKSGAWLAAAGSMHIASLLFLPAAALLAGRGAPTAPERIRRIVIATGTAVLPLALLYSAAFALGWLHGGIGSFARSLPTDSWHDREAIRPALGFLWFLRGVLPDFGIVGRAPSPTPFAWLDDLVRIPFLLFAAGAAYVVWDGWRKRAYLTWRFAGLPELCLTWFLCFEIVLCLSGRWTLRFWSLTLPPLWAYSAMWSDLRFGDPEAEGLRRMSGRAVLAVLCVLALEILTTGFLVVAPRHLQSIRIAVPPALSPIHPAK